MTIEQLRERPVAVTAGAFVALLLLVVLVRTLMARPQIGTEPEVYKTVDALFTALTSKDLTRLGTCRDRLHAFADEGKLPKSAAAQLESIMQQAENGDWTRSAHTLYDLMLAQRGTQ